MRVLLLLVLISSTLMAQLENDPRYVKRRAERYMARLNYERAITYLKNAATRIKDDGEIRILLGECYFAQSRWDKAADAFGDGVRVDSELAKSVAHFPLALIRNNELKKAEKQARVLASEGRNERAKANGNFCLGLIAWHRGLVDEAAGFFGMALKHDRTMPKAHYRLGVVHVKAKRFKEAVASFTEAVRLDPLHHAAAHNLSLAFRRIDDKSKAAQWRTRHREILKTSAEISALERELQRTPERTELVRRLADLFFKNKLYGRAIAPYSACVAAAPTAAEPRLLYARCLFETGDLHGARLQLNQIVDRHKDNKGARDLLQRIKQIVGSGDEGG